MKHVNDAVITEEMIAGKDNPEMTFFCRDCQWVVVDPKKRGHKYEYQCPICKGPKVVFGTRRSIVDYFNIKEAALERMLAEPNVKK